MSHPMWVRGLKLVADTDYKDFCKSHPMWVRGLKLNIAAVCALMVSVAPHVGAWIETRIG